ncbi:MAG: hypothetical protein JJT89_07475 [Nitriliruptoraceae bacterium]|nr:hypothetical protein [Nitriliruptoraceae bacterium]
MTTPGTTPSRRLVVLGDSAAAGHALASADEALGRRLARALTRGDGRATELVSVAVDGATTAEVAVTQLDAAQDAEVVVLGVGVNDAVDPWRRTADAAAALDALLGALHARLAPGAAVVLLSCPDLSAAPGLPWLIRPWVGRRCRALARRQGAVAVRHGVAVVAAPRAVLTLERFGADGFHPGASGHEELARRVVAALGGRVLDGVEGDAG